MLPHPARAPGSQEAGSGIGWLTQPWGQGYFRELAGCLLPLALLPDVFYSLPVEGLDLVACEEEDAGSKGGLQRWPELFGVMRIESSPRLHKTKLG